MIQVTEHNIDGVLKHTRECLQTATDCLRVGYTETSSSLRRIARENIEAVRKFRGR